MFRTPAQRAALCGLLTALMLVLGYVEHLIPLGGTLPGVKLGLSNSVLLFALYLLDTPTAFFLMALKAVLSSALFAGFGALPFALAGGLASLGAMALLKRMKGIRLLTVSMVGGAVHNMGQVLLAILFTHTAGLLGYMGLLMLAGLACGLLTGLCARAVIKSLSCPKR